MLTNSSNLPERMISGLNEELEWVSKRSEMDFKYDSKIWIAGKLLEICIFCKKRNDTVCGNLQVFNCSEVCTCSISLPLHVRPFRI